jgi:Lrp/AsnC family leucine-responsive transcriptional regulator
MIQVVVTDLAHFSRFLLDTLLASSAVADVNTSFVLKTVKADQGLPL